MGQTGVPNSYPSSYKCLKTVSGSGVGTVVTFSRGEVQVYFSVLMLVTRTSHWRKELDGIDNRLSILISLPRTRI